MKISGENGQTMFLITGANGFIGSSLVQAITEEESDPIIICSDRITPEERSAPLRNSAYTEFLKSEVFFEFLAGKEKVINCIFHMGACTDTTEQNEEFLHQNNTLYTQNLYLWCLKNNIPFIYASSAAIYGDGKNGFDDKQSSTNYVALNPYGKSKLDFDQWVSARSDQGRWYGLRFFNVFGHPESHKNNMASLVYKAFHQINETGCLKLFRSHNPKYKDGEQMRDFVYIKDIIRWIWEIYKRPQMKSGVYNMGFGKARTWLDLASATFNSMNREMKIEWVDIPTNIREQYQYFTQADISKLQEQGLSAPQWSLEKAVDNYIKNDLVR